MNNLTSYRYLSYIVEHGLAQFLVAIELIRYICLFIVFFLIISLEFGPFGIKGYTLNWK